MNNYLSLFVVILTVNQISAVISYEPQKLYLTIYYESHSLDSKDFVLRQLQPAVRLLHQYIVVRLIPFGKSKSINRGLNGFECKHGPKECLGNMVQDCTLAYMSGRSDADKVAYVACEMDHESGSKGNLACVHKANVPVAKVEQCINSEEGIRLQLNSEFLTRLARPSSIPTFVLDGMYTQEVQDSALIDLIGTLCSMSPNDSTNISRCCSDISADVESMVGQSVRDRDQSLSTVLKFDKENNLFGLANNPITKDVKSMKKLRRPEEKPAFYQTAIVLFCCGNKCYRNKSQSDMPASLKCRSCFGCTNCTTCFAPRCGPCGTGFCDCMPRSPCPSCDRCNFSKCIECPARCYGLKLVINRHPEYPPAPVEVIPRASCELNKPLAARTCTHTPHCIPPSYCFPYFMPCYWPGRYNAPCTAQGRCFHNPPCAAPRNQYPCNPEICAELEAYLEKVRSQASQESKSSKSSTSLKSVGKASSKTSTKKASKKSSKKSSKQSSKLSSRLSSKQSIKQPSKTEGLSITKPKKDNK